MTGLLTGIVLLGVLGVWLARRGRRPADSYDDREAVDREELEAAEREVRDLDLQQRPEEGFAGDDWGPGTNNRSTEQ